MLHGPLGLSPSGLNISPTSLMKGLWQSAQATPPFVRPVLQVRNQDAGLDLWLGIGMTQS
jgi:hypothetical protein